MSDKIVTVRGLVVAFGELRAVDDVDLDIERGTIHALLGPNGAGKTTLIRVLSTLLRPAAGTVHVADIDVLANPTAARAHIGLAGQFAAVDPYQTGRENVTMVGRLYGLSAAEARRRTDDVLERIALADAADRRVGTYSGGMRRRLDLAASLVGRPQVLFLDEPTTGIDPRSRQELWHLVEDLVDGGTTILLTTQYLEEADRLADDVSVINEGRIISRGTPEELKSALGTSTVEVTVTPERRSEVEQVLGDVDASDMQWDEERSRVLLSAESGTRTMMAVTRALDRAGIEPLGLAIHQPTLDDVFLALTGAPPEPDAPSGDAEGRAPAPGERQRRRGARR